MSMLSLSRAPLAAGGAAVGLALAGSLLAAPSAFAADEAQVSVLHAVPGATVDVWANGKPLITDFKPGTLTDPLTLPAGTYDLKVVKAGDPADAQAITEAAGVTVPAGANVTVAAHLTEKGTPTLTPFVNDTADTGAGKGRLTVRHVAAAPAVDVRANGAVAFAGLTNPKGVNAVLPAGTIKADVVLAGTDKVAIGPADVQVKAGVNTIVYAWGSAADSNLALAVQTVQAAGGAPAGVPAGNGGQAASQDSATRSLIAVGGAAVAGSAALLVLRRRATSRA